MLLFTATAVDVDLASWMTTGTYPSAGMRIDVAIGNGQHHTSVCSEQSDGRVAEVVSPSGLDVEDEPISSFHLPPFYRWERSGFSCQFTAEWREGVSSVAVSLRHMQSLRPHPRALLVEDPKRQVDLNGAPASAIVIGTPNTVEHPETGEPGTRVDWRGWHVIDGEDLFDGPTRRVLATHTEVFLRSN